MNRIFEAIIATFVVLALQPAFAIELRRPTPTSNKYTSEIDRNLTIKSIGVLPTTDNVKGIYSRGVEALLTEKTQALSRFSFIDLKGSDPTLTLRDYESRPKLVQELKSRFNVDAVIASRITKIGESVDLELDLFLSIDGLLLLKETKTGARFDSKDVERATKDLFDSLIKKLPYKGIVLSRQGNKVTIDLGIKDGITENTVINAEQFIAIKRHPKYGFIVSTDREILGKIKVVKVDETLSFGVIIQEKAVGVIEPDSKLSGIDFVQYERAETDSNDLIQNPPSLSDPVAFGPGAKEWIPDAKPKFGKLGMALGLGYYKNNLTLSSKAYSATNPIYPQMDLSAELWFTPTWFFGADIKQGVLSFSNPSGGSPSNLNSSIASYSAFVGYRMLLQDDFWGPQLKIGLGFSQYTLFVDASRPEAFSSTNYSGLFGTVGGWLPIDQENRWFFSADLKYHISPTLTESPNSSAAASSNSIVHFGFGGHYRLNNNFYLKGLMNFEFYSTNFSGAGTRSDADSGLSLSQSTTILFGGVDYCF